jgi:iron complex transport system substrate-binding protein
MSVCGTASRSVAKRLACALTAGALAAVGHVAPAGQPGQGAPARVVSINLCTDQLAMLLAAPGQLVSVSTMAREAESSALAHEARGWPVNSGAAEEVFLLRPDVVLAGSFAARATVDLLRRLGIEVAEFAPENSLADVRATIRRMGRVLGREAAAQTMLVKFDRGLADLRRPIGEDAPTAAIYGANGYLPGAETLASDILTAAGLNNLAAKLGMAGSGALPLEQLILSRPDVVIRPGRYSGASRAEAILDHPALVGLPAPAHARTGPEWVCPTPMLLKAVADMARVRDDMAIKR